MNAAKIANSQRLQRVDKLLADGRVYTTRDIINLASVCAVSSCVAELKDPINGRIIHCWRIGKIWHYRRDLLAEKRKQAVEA